MEQCVLGIDAKFWPEEQPTNADPAVLHFPGRIMILQAIPFDCKSITLPRGNRLQSPFEGLTSRLWNAERLSFAASFRESAFGRLSIILPRASDWSGS